MGKKKQIESFESLVTQLKNGIAANISDKQMNELVAKFEQKVKSQNKANKGFNNLLLVLLLLFASICVGWFLALERNGVLEQKITNMEYRDSLFYQIMQPDSNSTIVYRVRNDIPVTYHQLANQADSLEALKSKLRLVTRNYPISFTEKNGVVYIHSSEMDSALLLLPVYRDKIKYDSKRNAWCVTRTDSQ